MTITKWPLPLVAVLIVATAACRNPPVPTTTSVGKSVATLVKSSGLTVNTCQPGAIGAPPGPTDWWNAMPAANHQFPFAGWETNRRVPTTGCIDAYRALVTFNMASVSNLKGLVQKAELVISTRAMPPAAGNGGVVSVGTSPSTVTLVCPALIGGAGTLQRFGPSAAGTLPAVSGTGEFQILTPTDSFPAGPVVFTFPANLNSTGPIAGAIDPTVAGPNGLGGSYFTTDVTGGVTAALNAAAAGMSWMLTANFEGPLPGSLPLPGTFDCRTSYAFDLRITHY